MCRECASVLNSFRNLHPASIEQPVFLISPTARYMPSNMENRSARGSVDMQTRLVMQVISSSM